MRIPMILSALTIATGANATECIGSDSVFEVASWSAEIVDSGIYRDVPRLNVEVRNISGKKIRMTETYVRFDDALGGKVFTGHIDRDVHVDPGGEVSRSFTGPDYGANRLATSLLPEDVLAYACTSSVLYDDGSIERFDGQ